MVGFRFFFCSFFVFCWNRLVYSSSVVSISPGFSLIFADFRCNFEKRICSLYHGAGLFDFDALTDS